MTNRTDVDFTLGLTATSRRALLELVRALHAYSEAMVLIGGWVPYLLLQSHPRDGQEFVHVGSIDIDFVLDPDAIGDDEYRTIVGLISDQGWTQNLDSKFSFLKDISGPDRVPRKIKVDFLTKQKEDGSRGRRHREVQGGLEARILDSAELALAHHAPQTIAGALPDETETEVTVEVLDVVGCIGTKAYALAGRMSNKDAYDIVSIWDNYGTGVKEVGELMRPSVGEPLVAQAVTILQKKFQTPKSEGPMWYANFLARGEATAHDRLSQRAYQLSSDFFKQLI
jgi:Nucleotidyl transferase AbiEii toxin, Type IV TA system